MILGEDGLRQLTGYAAFLKSRTIPLKVSSSLRFQSRITAPKNDLRQSLAQELDRLLEFHRARRR
jgi:hypothetical protein